MIIGIIAIAKNFAIGQDGKLPWHYPADLKFFKQMTTGNAIVMGRKTFESIGKPLPKRLNIVLSRTAALENASNILVLRSKEEVMALTEYLKGDIFIIGGAKTYTEFADIIEKWIVTEIPETVEKADAFMPEDFLNGFKILETRELENDLKIKIYGKTF